MCLSVHKQGKYEEKFIGENLSFLQADVSAEIMEVKPHVAKNMANKQPSLVSKPGPNGMIIRGMTFYKSEPDPMVADDGEPGENCKNKYCTLQPFQAMVYSTQRQVVLSVEVSYTC